MDERPVFEFKMLDIKESAVKELKKSSKSIFELDYILNTASELKYTREIKRLLRDQMQEPTDEFVRSLASRVYSGRMTQGV
jgi:predicted type IV restriction endonuclease